MSKTGIYPTTKAKIRPWLERRGAAGWRYVSEAEEREAKAVEQAVQMVLAGRYEETVTIAGQPVTLPTEQAVTNWSPSYGGDMARAARYVLTLGASGTGSGSLEGVIDAIWQQAAEGYSGWRATASRIAAEWKRDGHAAVERLIDQGHSKEMCLLAREAVRHAYPDRPWTQQPEDGWSVGEYFYDAVRAWGAPPGAAWTREEYLSH